jgi:hypothetical protein
MQKSLNQLMQKKEKTSLEPLPQKSPFRRNAYNNFMSSQLLYGAPAL